MCEAKMHIESSPDFQPNFEGLVEESDFIGLVW